MGTSSNFCDCNNIKEANGTETNLGFISTVNNILCPIQKLSTYNKNDYTYQYPTQNFTVNDNQRNISDSTYNAKLNNNITNEININHNMDRVGDNYQIGLLKNQKISRNDYINNYCLNAETNNTDNKTTKDNLNNKMSSYNHFSKNSIHISTFSHMQGLSFERQKSYRGGKINGKKDGFGINILSNNSQYIGYHKNNKAHGFGKYIDGNVIYEGEFENNFVHGYGIFYNNNEMSYEGYWVNNFQETYGIENWKDGSTYIGQYYKGKKNGIGTYTWSDGTRYEGEWKNNNFEGYGIYYFSNSKAYFGEWKNKKKEGFGEYIWSDRKYIGYYKNDKKDGIGIILWKDGNKSIIGFWRKGKQLGFGKYMSKKKTYFGIWNFNDKIEWFKTESQGIKYLEENKLERYKKIFQFNLSQVFNYCNNNDNLENIFREEVAHKKRINGS